MTTPHRFSIASWIASLVLAVLACPASAQSLPLNISTNYSDPSQVYITFQCSNPTTFKASYVDATSGQTVQITCDTAKGTSGLSSSIPVSAIKGGVITLGYMDSGLIYASIGGTLDQSTAAPSPNDPNDPAYNIPWQNVAEITYTNTPADSGDITSIQFFSVPSRIQVLTGPTTVVQQAQINVAPATLYSEIAALSTTPDVVAIKSTKGTNIGQIVRVLAPNQFGQTSDNFGTTYFAIGGYPSFHNYVNSIYLANNSTTISGTIQETINSITNTVAYNFVSTVNSSLDIVTQGTYTYTPSNGDPSTTSIPYTITIPHDYVLTDGSGITNYTQSSALYFCPSTALGAPIAGTTNFNTTDTGVTVSNASTIDPYILAQVLHDLTSGYNFGFINSATVDPHTSKAFGTEASSVWFQNAVTSVAYEGLQPNNPYYNQYANLIDQASQGTCYGFPYADAIPGVTLNTVQYPATQPPTPVTGWNILIGTSGSSPGTQPQTITFPAIPNQVLNPVPLTLNATASSGLPVTYSVAGPASISGNSLTMKGAGTIHVAARQAGNSTYKAAAPVVQTFTVAKASQVITFAPIPNQFVGAQVALTATASSGYTVSYAITGPAKLSGKTLTTTGVGTVSVTASQPGNANFNPAANVKQSFSVTQAPQTITFPTIPNQNYGNPPFALAATASSGLPVSYTASGPATVSGNTVTITGVGTATITAHQAGNANYAAAKNVAKNFNIGKEAQTITFPPIPAQKVGSVFAVMASSTSGLPVTLSVNSGPATISGNVVTVTGVGNVKIKAVQAGNATVAAAPSLLQTFSATQ